MDISLKSVKTENRFQVRRIIPFVIVFVSGITVGKYFTVGHNEKQPVLPTHSLAVFEQLRPVAVTAMTESTSINVSFESRPSKIESEDDPYSKHQEIDATKVSSDYERAMHDVEIKNKLVTDIL